MATRPRSKLFAVGLLLLWAVLALIVARGIDGALDAVIAAGWALATLLMTFEWVRGRA